ncbi:hypothetical protein EV144_103349 [Flavobacterium sp. 270]|uniref:hypothetical protein n=1 Tax=Flavobacterium sp. 270 TaxID=2512114 RepID=UPI0010651B34|nr:hypothetical protein [Flavobacterium sp. 270]TDW48832.1 hypothetical protein EV144_103349 [Flavobacterium sp. 270]
MNNIEAIRIINQNIKNIKIKINKFNFYAAILIGTGIALVFVFFAFFYFAKKENYEYLVDVGTISGGIVSSLFSLGGLILVYVAFLGQEQQNLNQQIVNLNNEEEIKRQNNASQIQHFENLFFRLLANYNETKSTFYLLRDINIFSSFIQHYNKRLGTFAVLRNLNNRKLTYASLKKELNFDTSFILQINSILKFTYQYDFELIKKNMYIEIFTSTISTHEKKCVYLVYHLSDELTNENKENIDKSDLLNGITLENI